MEKSTLGEGGGLKYPIAWVGSYWTFGSLVFVYLWEGGGTNYLYAWRSLFWVLWTIHHVVAAADSWVYDRWAFQTKLNFILNSHRYYLPMFFLDQSSSNSYCFRFVFETIWNMIIQMNTFAFNSLRSFNVTPPPFWRAPCPKFELFSHLFPFTFQCFSWINQIYFRNMSLLTVQRVQTLHPLFFWLQHVCV